MVKNIVQKDSERMNEKAAIPRQKPKGLCCNLFNLIMLKSYTASKNVPDTKEPDLKLVDETQERQGTKRKTSQLNNAGKIASMPLKKAKTIEEPKSTSARVAPRQNSASATPHQKPASVTPRHTPTLSSFSIIFIFCIFSLLFCIFS